MKFSYLNLSNVSQNYFEIIWMSILIKTSCFENHYEGASFIQVWEKIRNILKQYNCAKIRILKSTECIRVSYSSAIQVFHIAFPDDLYLQACVCLIIELQRVFFNFTCTFEQLYDLIE